MMRLAGLDARGLQRIRLTHRRCLCCSGTPCCCNPDRRAFRKQRSRRRKTLPSEIDQLGEQHVKMIRCVLHLPYELTEASRRRDLWRLEWVFTSFREQLGEMVDRLGRVGGGDRRCGGVNRGDFDANRGRAHVRVRRVHSLLRTFVTASAESDPRSLGALCGGSGNVHPAVAGWRLRPRSWSRMDGLGVGISRNGTGGRRMAKRQAANRVRHQRVRFPWHRAQRLRQLDQ